MSRLDEIRERVENGVLDVETLMAAERDMADLVKFVDLMLESAQMCTMLAAVTTVAASAPGRNSEALTALADLYSAVNEQVHTNLKSSNLE